MNNIYLKIREFQEVNPHLVLATVIETKGSTPQKSGSSALFSAKGLVAGTIGGGVLEGRVQKISAEAVGTRKLSLFHYELDSDIKQKEEAICGGTAMVLIDPLIADYISVFNEIADMPGKRIPCILVTIFKTNASGDNKINRHIFDMGKSDCYPAVVSDKIYLKGADLLSLKQGETGFVKIDFSEPGTGENGFVLLEALFPPHKLIIAGAGHIGKSLAHFGRLLDFEVTVIDDRAEFACKENIPDADHLIADDIEKAMTGIEKDRNTFIVIVTRGHSDDARALKPCIGSNAAYIGMIGSRTKIALMHKNFIEKGWASEEQWSGIHAPIGLEINSKTVEEISVSIAAELILIRNRLKN